MNDPRTEVARNTCLACQNETAAIFTRAAEGMEGITTADIKTEVARNTCLSLIADSKLGYRDLNIIAALVVSLEESPAANFCQALNDQIEDLPPMDSGPRFATVEEARTIMERRKGFKKGDKA